MEHAPPATPASGVRPTSPFAAGQVVGDAYRVERVLGEGGMGVVYEATDLVLPRRVALKAARVPAFAEALRREAQALASIRHPGFVTVHQFGREGDVDYFVMERIFGDTLEARLAALAARADRLAIDEVLDLLVDVTDALSAAHRAGVAHRDLKASNVLLSVNAPC